MKTIKQIRNKLYKKNSEWSKLSQIHANSKNSKFKNHVTDEEHITGEELCRIEGWMFALEWILNIGIKVKPSLKERTTK